MSKSIDRAKEVAVFFVRQGDVGIRRVTAIPKGAMPVKRTRGRIILAEGEVTGHAHAIVDDEATLVRSSDGRTFLRLDAPATVVHEEHAPINLAPGAYEVIRQREYSPEAIRNVAD